MSYNPKMRSRYAASCRTSSPLTRGKQPAASGRMGASGLISAHTGKTGLCRCRGSVRWAHPRSCGANVATTYTVGTRRGSSPLTRGKLVGPEGILLEAGLIPTRAGKTPRCTSPPQTCAAYPHSRGENEFALLESLSRTGSSPLTRGKRVQERGRPDEGGLIPAHAGKTCPRIRRAWAAPAHPHSRWENS